MARPTHGNTVSRRPSMPLVAALEVLARLRSDEIVITSMGSAREWPKISQHPLDLLFVPSAMGNAPALGLGLALARPDRQVIAINGDGSMLMSLGSLVTIASQSPPNFTLVILCNDIYEVTGGQKIAAATARVDWCGLVRAAGIGSVRHFADLEAWQPEAAETLALPGPRVVVLDVEPVGANYFLESPGPMAERIARFQAALG